jgi:hypothetical protein
LLDSLVPRRQEGSVRHKPTVFVGSSSERLNIVTRLAKELQPDVEVLRWDKNVFVPGRFTLEDLQDAMKRSDFAIFVFAGDDIVKWRKKVNPAPRDNVVLEIGMAIGMIGHRRLLLLYSRRDRAKMPSDLLGFNYVPLEDVRSKRHAITQAAEVIRQQLIAEGLRDLPTDSDRLITHHQRSAFSTEFASKTIHTFDIFAGDLSWLERDLPTYRALAQRRVFCRFLTDTPGAAVIPRAKRMSMSFREYPAGSEARIKASLSDANFESDARALVVQKRVVSLHAAGRKRPYDYRMKIYSGPKEYSVIAALSSYFNELFRRGRSL